MSNKLSEHFGISPKQEAIPVDNAVDNLKHEIKNDSVQTVISLGAVACYGAVLDQFVLTSGSVDNQNLKLAAIGAGMFAIGNRIHDVAKRSIRTRKNMKEIKQIKEQNAESSVEIV